MKYGILAAVVLAAGLDLLSPGTGSVAAQSQPSAGATKAWNGRTAWNDPDLQGIWETIETGTPMERPKEMASREFLTDQELSARIETLKTRNAAPPPDPDGNDPRDARASATAPEHEKKIFGQEYNRFWVDSGPRRTKPWRRTSLIIDPPDGRMPAFTPDAIKRIEEREAARRNRGEADSWVDRNVNERCLQTAFLRIGGGERQIRQVPGYVVITQTGLNANEPVIVPLDGRPRPSTAVRTWLGVSRGRWEGSTLVVETTNINGKQDGGSVMASRTPYQRFLGAGDTLRITERFRRVDAETIEYSYTVDDPKTYVKPYTILRPLAKLDDDYLLPENGCHEGNYGIVGQLSAGRADEAYAMKAAQAEAAGRQPQLQEMKRKTEEWLRNSGQKR